MNKKDCVFCKIIKGEIPSNFVYKDDKIIIIKSIDPKAKIHLLAIPINHFSNQEKVSTANSVVLGHIHNVLSSKAKKLGIENGYRIIVNMGVDAEPEIKHLHFHILAGERLGDIR